MTSVTRFLRQIPNGQTHYELINTIDASGGIFYRFVPDTANYVGNYPPGYMYDITTDVSDALVGDQAVKYVLRDMGKTFRAQVGPAPGGDVAFFRQMQLIFPSGSVSANLYATFGVAGGPTSPVADAPYFTVYLPIPVDGRGFILPAGVYCVVAASGQM
jgi:hypothetical protein